MKTYRLMAEYEDGSTFNEEREAESQEEAELKLNELIRLAGRGDPLNSEVAGIRLTCSNTGPPLTHESPPS